MSFLMNAFHSSSPNPPLAASPAPFCDTRNALMHGALGVRGLQKRKNALRAHDKEGAPPTASPRSRPAEPGKRLSYAPACKFLAENLRNSVFMLNFAVQMALPPVDRSRNHNKTLH